MLSKKTPLAVLVVLSFASWTNGQLVLDVPSSYPTIQSAINAAGPGSVVSVAPGVYNERIDLLGKNIIVRSASGPHVTTIDGQGLTTPLIQTALTPITSRIEGFTVTGALAGSGGSAFDNGFTNNVAATAGSAEIVDCIFSANSSSPHTVALRAVSGARPHVRRSLFNANYPTASPFFFGATVSAIGGCNWIIEDCQFIANPSVAVSCSSGSVGGTNIDILRTDFIDNGPFGAISFDGTNVVAPSPLTATIDGCRFIGNVGQALFSGAITARGSAQSIDVRRSIFRGNSSPAEGGAVLVFNIRSSSFRDCLFDSNVSGISGGALTIQVLAGYPTPTISQSTFFGNVAPSGGGAIYCGQIPGSLPIIAVESSIIRSNSSPQVKQVASAFFVAFCDIEGGWAGAGTSNFDADPMWRDADSSDFRTLPSSPVIDAGHPAGTWDEDGTLPDIGAFLNKTFGPAGDSRVPWATSTGFASLVVGGGIGGAMQERRLPLGSAVDFEIRPTPDTSFSTEWLLFGYFGFPTSGVTLPLGFGEIVMPSPFSSGDPNSFLIGSSVPGLGSIGGYPAPFRSESYTIGFPLEMVFQAVVRIGDIDYRSSNAVRLIVP